MVSEDIWFLQNAIRDSCKKQGRYAEAEKFDRIALDSRITAQGKSTPETIKAMIDLSYVLIDAKKLTEGEELTSETYMLCMEELVEDDQLTIEAVSLRA